MTHNPKASEFSIMPSDRFIADMRDLSPLEFFGVFRDYFDARLTEPKLRAKASEELFKILLELAPDETEANEPLLQVAEFCDSVGEPPPMVVAGVLEANTVLLVSAKPKTGKTFLMLQMADDIASGTPLFGQYEIERPGPVVYLAMEGSKYQFSDRLKKRGMYERNPEVYIYHTRRDLSKPSGVKWLVDLITPLNPSCVIIDTARQAFQMDDWNNASLVQMRLQPLVEAVQRNSVVQFPSGCACMIVHHNNKNSLATGGDRISGTNAFQGIVDGYMVLDGRKRLENGDLQFTGECEGRIDLPDSITFVMDTTTLRVRAVDDGEAAALKAEHANAAMKSKFVLVSDIIEKESDGMTAGEIETKTGLAKSYVSKILSAMAAEGRVLKNGTRKTGKTGFPAVVYIVPPQDSSNKSSSYIKENTLSNVSEMPSKDAAENAVNRFFEEPADAPEYDEI